MRQIKNTSVLVTGGAGFIGSHLCVALVNLGAKVTVVDNFSKGNIENLDPVSKYMNLKELDVNTRKFSKLISLGEFDLVFHMAGSASVPLSVENPEHDFVSNLSGTFRLLESIRLAGVETAVVVVSSAAVYGTPSRIPISESDPTTPISPYGVSKLAIERYVYVYSQLYGLRAASLRPFSVYGPKLRKQIIYDFIRKLFDDPSRLTIIGDGSQVRDFIYVDDVVQAALVVFKKGRLEGEVYNVAGGKGYSTREVAETLVDLMEVSPEYHYTMTNRPGDPDTWIASIDKLRSLGYSPSVVLRTGLEQTLEWFNASHRR